MSWDLRFQGRTNPRDYTQWYLPLGSRAEVAAILGAYFRSIDWENEWSSYWIDDDGKCEFHIHGDPVENVGIRNHCADVTASLIALSRECSWDVVDEDASAVLDDEVEIDEIIVSRPQNAAKCWRLRSSSGEATPEVPRIKKRMSLVEYGPSWSIERWFGISLRDG